MDYKIKLNLKTNILNINILKMFTLGGLVVRCVQLTVHKKVKIKHTVPNPCVFLSSIKTKGEYIFLSTMLPEVCKLPSFHLPIFRNISCCDLIQLKRSTNPLKNL